MTTHVLPHDLAAERNIIGGILIHPKAISEIVGYVAASDFYHPAHAAIFAAMLELDDASRPIDQVTVAEQMRANASFKALRALNGEAYFAELTSAVVTVENIAYHAQLVRSKATVRKLIEAAQEIAAHGYGDYGDVDEYLEGAERTVFDIVQQSSRTTPETIRRILKGTIDAIEQRHDRKQLVTGVPSGFRALDEMTAGFQPGDLVIIAARPSMGKTSLVMNAVQNAALHFHVPALVFSLEMSKESLVERMLSAEGRIDSTRLRNGQLTAPDWIHLTEANRRLVDAMIRIDDAGAPTLAEIRAKARRWRADSKIFTSPDQLGILVVDYLQLMAGKGGRERNREQEISEMSRGLKALAKELRVPVIALSQLNRSADGRRPGLADLRESGAIEQDADLVAFIYRDEKEPTVAEIIIGKQRCGPVGTRRLGFDVTCTRFYDLETAT